MNIQAFSKAYMFGVAMFLTGVVMCNVQMQAQSSTDSLTADEMETLIVNAIKEEQQQRTFRKDARAYR